MRWSSDKRFKRTGEWVLLKTEIGGTRLLDLPFTEQLLVSVNCVAVCEGNCGDHTHMRRLFL